MYFMKRSLLFAHLEKFFVNKMLNSFLLLRVRTGHYIKLLSNINCIIEIVNSRIYLLTFNFSIIFINIDLVKRREYVIYFNIFTDVL